MTAQNYAHLLFNAVRETLETMAFAEVIPCSFKIDDVEQDFDTDTFTTDASEQEESVSEPPVDESTTTDAEAPDAWGTPSTNATESLPAATNEAGDSWGTPVATEVDSGNGADWGQPTPENHTESTDWGQTAGSYDLDPWGDTAATEGRIEGISIADNSVDFKTLVDNQEDWCWSCMRVNSPEIHSVWFIISWGLASELATNMYAGESLTIDNPLIRDLLAELTNVLGGRLMILLEKLGGSFTLTVPEIGTGMPDMPEGMSLHTVLCKAVIDNEYPVITTLCFNTK